MKLTPDTLATIEADPEFPSGYYASHVLHNGDTPGVLSGAELAGKAKEFGGWYARQRARVEAVARKHGVSTEYDKSRHGAKVWVV